MIQSLYVYGYIVYNHPVCLTSPPTSVCCSPEKVMRSNHKWGIYHDLPSNSDGQELWKVHQNGDLTKKNWGLAGNGGIPLCYFNLTGKMMRSHGSFTASPLSEKPTWETGEVGGNHHIFSAWKKWRSPSWVGAMKPGTSSRLQLLLQLLLQLGLHNLLQLLLHDFQELRLQLLTQGTRESRLGKVHRVGVDQWEQPDMFFSASCEDKA